MWTLFPPGNFWVFIIGTIVSSIIGTAILFRYKNNWLNYLHASLYFICAALFVSEYALQQADAYEQATIPHLLNGLFFYFFSIAGWPLNYWCINPLAKWKYKKQIDIFIAVGVLGIPILISLYFILTDQIFDLSNEKINGLWRFKIKDSIAADFHNIHTHRVVPPIMMFSFIYGVVFAAKKRRRAIISLITFIGMAIGVSGFYDISMPGWHVSSTAFPLFITIGFLSWFIMDYKLDSSYDNALNDLLNSISDLVIQTDKNLKVNLTNAVLNSFFEQPEGSITAFLSKNSRYSGSEINGYLNRLTNQEVESDTLTLIDKKGKERQFQLKVSELDWRGKKKGYTFLLNDMTVLKEREQQLEVEKAKSDELLLNILPAKVAEELKQNGKAKAQRFESVTVFFSDFENFTKISEQLTPEEIVEELDYCFRNFDKIMERYNLEKIKTIGDAYMCAGGIPISNKEAAINVVKAALDIQTFLRKSNKVRSAKNLPEFRARIGIHTGPIVAGIVGSKKFAYDIWGDTVNTAARIESNGEVDKVNISQSTHDIVKNHFDCTFRGGIQAKNKGKINMYFVQEKNIVF